MLKRPGIILRMNKLALIGKDISHSRSPEMYRKLISPNIDYSLLDYDNANKIPSAKDLFLNYDGINITSPYKKYFLDQIKLTKNASAIGAVNCLKKQGTDIIGENTDYLAVVDILKEIKSSHATLEVVILGDGVMSTVAQLALKNLSIEYKVFSRKLTNNFDQLNFDLYFSNHPTKPLIINACARDFIFHGKLPIRGIFWDFNYNFKQQEDLISPCVEMYMDGLEMLERQAFYAVAFWSNHTAV